MERGELKGRWWFKVKSDGKTSPGDGSITRRTVREIRVPGHFKRSHIYDNNDVYSIPPLFVVAVACSPL